MADKLQKILDSYKMNPQEATKKSKTWFDQQVTLLGKQRIGKPLLMQTREGMEKKSKLIPGSMFMFQYEALGDGVLPYWDRFPLIIPFRAVPGGFFGLNMHYLHPQIRAKLLDGLMVHATNKNLDETTKLKFTWAMAQGAARTSWLNASVKQYKLSQVRSPFMKIDPQYWVSALMLPTESFVGASKQQVWKESRRA